MNFDLANELDCEQRARAETNRELQLRDDFLAVVAHELRTPLNAIVGWAQLIAAGEVDAEKLDRAIGVIIRNAKAQERIISDLYDAASISKGKFAVSLELLRLPVTVAEAVETILPAANDKKVCIKHHAEDDNLMVYGDDVRLRQAICNLLGNAVKFTPESGAINVWCGARQQAAQITVSDTGCGIPPEILPRIFDRSFQVNSGNGLGLGLTIARHIVERHGGTVQAGSFGDDIGSTFTVQLPLAEVF